MKERPILFSASMVRALLDGSKTQTRRACKPAQFYSLSAVVEVPDPMERGQVYNGSHFGDEEGEVQFACPYGGRGDQLWVRETFVMGWPLNGHGIVDKYDDEGHEKPKQTFYRASNPDLTWCDGSDDTPIPVPWKPSIHMPRAASRITLEVTSVRVERLQDISEADAMAEGIAYGPTCDEGGRSGGYHWDRNREDEDVWPAAVQAFRQLWIGINGPHSWAANPWVWVVEFKRFQK